VVRLFACLVLLTPAVASAQQRPLVTEDPETIGAGQVLVEGGFEYDRNVEYPVSGYEGQLLRFAVLGVNFGVSSIAEVQVDGGLHDRLTVTKRDPSASNLWGIGPSDEMRK